MSDAQREYVRKGRNAVAGWFFRVDGEIFCSITDYQNENALDGSVAEIGLHHGKSFIAMCLALRGGQKAYGIDVFEQQSLNIDGSGRGDRFAVERNLKEAGVDLSAVVLDGRSSTSVSPGDILGSVGAVRLFSIDGAHQIDVVRNDLLLAEQTLAEHGVIALDDFFRPEWPDVSAAFFAWFAQRTKPIVPFSIGCNKLYLCHQSHVLRYKEVLLKSAFLRIFLSRHYDFCGNEIPVFQEFLDPDWGWKQQVTDYVKRCNPDLYLSLGGLRFLRHLRLRSLLWRR